MFKKLRVHPKIIVTGCQRSGTRILAKMISHDTGHPYIDETEYHIHNEGKFLVMYNQIKTGVIHAPNWLSMQIVPDILKSTAIVHLNRDKKAILRSMERIQWFPRAVPLLQKLGISNPSLWHIMAYPDLVQSRWENDLRFRALWYGEVDYESLQEHPLWVEPKKRTNFKWDQTEVISEKGEIDGQDRMDSEIPPDSEE